MDIYFVRHGQTDYNIEGRYYGKTDIPLNQSGRDQASQLADFFSNITLDKILCSPLKRAYETATIIQEKNKIEIEREDLLCEQDFGVFEGKTFRQIEREYPIEWREWNEDFFYTAPPKGESFSKVRDRMRQFLGQLRQRKESSILIVAHKGTFGHLAAEMLGMPLDGFWNFIFEQGRYSQISLEDGYFIIKKINARPVVSSFLEDKRYR